MEQIRNILITSLLMTVSLFALGGTVKINGDACGDVSGSMSVSASGDVEISTTGNCGLKTTGGGDPDPVPTNYTLTVSKTGSGTVAGNGIDCGSTCVQTLASATSVTLVATPASGSEFVSWSGACTGSANCNLSMTSNRSVTATFRTITTDGPSCAVGAITEGNMPGVRTNYSLKGNTTLALKITASQGNPTVTNVSGLRSASRIMKVSECKGDTETGGNRLCRSSHNESGSVYYSATTGCVLTPGKTYYLNIRHTTCSADNSCGFSLTP